MNGRSRGMTGSTPALDLLVDGLAVHRLARLIVTDQIADPLRARAMAAMHDRGWEWGKELLRCEWCVGVWVAGAVTAARVLAPRAWRPAARFLAVADVAGIVSSNV